MGDALKLGGIEIVLLLLAWWTLATPIGDYADEVWDAGDRLIVIRDKTRAEVMLSSIAIVEYDRELFSKSQVAHVFLLFHKMCELGPFIKFVPPFQWYGTPPIVKELQYRVAKAAATSQLPS